MSGINLLAEYVFLSKYSQKKPDGLLESWDETVDRIYNMHKIKLEKDIFIEKHYENRLDDMLQRAINLEKSKVMLSSQRGRQFASTSETSGILKHESKIYNCCSTYIDRLDVFSETMYLLLSGCGVGYSLHKKYIDRLPVVAIKSNKELDITFVVEDSIEGWADSIEALVAIMYESHSNLPEFYFNYSNIRPKGALIDGKFSAPGHEPLEKAHKNIINVFMGAQGRKLNSLELHDIMCYIAESVVSGGVRRSAMIALFDKDDELMLRAKTGTWWNDNPQRAMANNSILCELKDSLNYNELKGRLQVVRQFGEPGFVNVPDYKYTVNPCAEIVMDPSFGRETGFAFCNLVEINAEKVANEREFYEACRVASFVATVQSLYTNFKYLSIASIKIAERDRAIGVSITGIYANPILKDEVLRKGARIVYETNAMWADIFKINRSRTCTTIKPSGNASSILGLYCSGIHPAHDHTYLRRVRIKTYSPEFKALKDTPLVKVLRGDEAVISFPIESKNDQLVTKDEVSAIDHLKFIAMVKHYWINKGCEVPKSVSNNISATIEVKDDEWDEVASALFINDHLFTGVSLLPKLGDQIYDNAPFQRLSSPEVIAEFNAIKEYLDNNTIDFLSIMSQKEDINAGDLAAIGCAGGACELR